MIICDSSSMGWLIWKAQDSSCLVQIFFSTNPSTRCWVLNSTLAQFHVLIFILEVNNRLRQRRMRIETITSRFLPCLCQSLIAILTNDKNFETYTHLSTVSYHKLTGCPCTNECRILESILEAVLDPLTHPNTQKLSLTLSWRIFQTCHYKLSKEQNDPSVS